MIFTKSIVSIRELFDKMECVIDAVLMKKIEACDVAMHETGTLY
jgi:hypothetical protein